MLMFTSLRDANVARQKEWFGSSDSHTSTDILFRAVELGGEVGEALNKVKKLAREMRGAVGTRASIDEIADELADVIVCVDLLAISLSIDDLRRRVGVKFNATSEKYGLSTRLSVDGTL